MSPVQEDRFEFGENWKSFLKLLDQERIDRAIDSLQEKLQIENFQDKRLLDLGCGSGLFSLAAHQMGADVVSIDFDPSSVQCTEELRKRFGNENKKWIIQRGSALDAGYMRSLGEFDIVYSWGVLHHTGDMNQAILLASERVIEGGRFMIAIYNDQGQVSIRWHRIKRLYHRFPQAAPARFGVGGGRLLRNEVWIVETPSWKESTSVCRLASEETRPGDVGLA